jgi:hypothetical protein
MVYQQNMRKRKNKMESLSKLEELDRTHESQQGVSEQCSMRYQLEVCLEQIYHKEEMYWHKEVVKSGFLRVMSTLSTFTPMPMEGGGKPGYVSWRLKLEPSLIKMN